MPKAVRWKDGAGHTARVLGKADRLGENYRWDRDNQHTVVMDDGDVEVLQSVHPETAKEFAFKDLPAEQTAEQPQAAAGEGEPVGDTGAADAGAATGRRG